MTLRRTHPAEGEKAMTKATDALITAAKRVLVAHDAYPHHELFMVMELLRYKIADAEASPHKLEVVSAPRGDVSAAPG
jgi:hypothetical protein